MVVAREKRMEPTIASEEKIDLFRNLNGLLNQRN